MGWHVQNCKFGHFPTCEGTPKAALHTITDYPLSVQIPFSVGLEYCYGRKKMWEKEKCFSASRTVNAKLGLYKNDPQCNAAHKILFLWGQICFRTDIITHHEILQRWPIRTWISWPFERGKGHESMENCSMASHSLASPIKGRRRHKKWIRSKFHLLCFTQ